MPEVHYTYITRSPDGRYYIGVRTCEGDPADDPYMGSHRDPTYAPNRKRVLATFDSREEAYEHEIFLHELRQVDSNPRYANRAKQRSTGFFYDKGTPGESHPMWGKHHTDEARAKISAAQKGRSSHLKGTKFSEERLARQSELTRGENNGMYGKRHSDEARRKLREVNLGKVLPEETKSKISEGCSEWWSSDEGLSKRRDFSERFSGDGNPFYGRTHDEKTREKIREANLGKELSEEHRRIVSETFKGKPKSAEQRRKMSESQKGLKWFHHPVTSERTKCRPEDQPEGYVPGLGKKKLSKTASHPTH